MPRLPATMVRLPVVAGVRAPSRRREGVHQALCGCLLILVENILPKKRSSLTPPTTNGETPPTRTAIAPNYLTFYFLQIRTAGSFDLGAGPPQPTTSFDKEPAIILLSAATNAVCGADIGIIDFGNHERFILHDSPQLDPTACRLPRRRVVLRAVRRCGRACSRRS